MLQLAPTGPAMHRPPQRGHAACACLPQCASLANACNLLVPPGESTGSGMYQKTTPPHCWGRHPSGRSCSRLKHGVPARCRMHTPCKLQVLQGQCCAGGVQLHTAWPAAQAALESKCTGMLRPDVASAQQCTQCRTLAPSCCPKGCACCSTGGAMTSTPCCRQARAAQAVCWCIAPLRPTGPGPQPGQAHSRLHDTGSCTAAAPGPFPTHTIAPAAPHPDSCVVCHLPSGAAGHATCYMYSRRMPAASLPHPTVSVNTPKPCRQCSATCRGQHTPSRSTRVQRTATCHTAHTTTRVTTRRGAPKAMHKLCCTFLLLR